MRSSGRRGDGALLVAVVLTVVACMSGPDGRLVEAERRIGASVGGPAPEAIALIELGPPRWDRAVLFGPCEFSDVIRSELGVPWSGAESIERTAFCGDIDLVRYLIVFVDVDAVTGWLLVNGDRDLPQATVDVETPLHLMRDATLTIDGSSIRVR
jgi:hypothetical protein